MVSTALGATAARCHRSSLRGLASRCRPIPLDSVRDSGTWILIRCSRAYDDQIYKSGRHPDLESRYHHHQQQQLLLYYYYYYYYYYHHHHYNNKTTNHTTNHFNFLISSLPTSYLRSSRIYTYHQSFYNTILHIPTIYHILNNRNGCLLSLFLP